MTIMRRNLDPDYVKVKFKPLKNTNYPKTSCFYFRLKDNPEKGQDIYECGRYRKVKGFYESTIEYITNSLEDAQSWIDIQVSKENEKLKDFIL